MTERARSVRLWRGGRRLTSKSFRKELKGRRAGRRGQVSARRVFTAAAQGDERAAEVVAEEARLVARVLCSVVTIVDPALVVLGGGIGQAPGFAAAVTRELELIAPVLPEVRVSALGNEAVVDGCLAAGAELAWTELTVRLPGSGSHDGQRPALTGPAGPLAPASQPGSASSPGGT